MRNADWLFYYEEKLDFLMQTLSHLKTSDAAHFYPFLFVQEIR